MFNIGYFKAQPTEYIIKYASGRVAREGQGLAFFYLKHNTQVVAVPTSSMDANLVFNEVTSNFQAVTIQGQFTYRIHDPKRAAGLLNFTMDPVTHQYVSNDPDQLAQRITNVIQMETRTEIQRRSLEEVLSQFEAIAAERAGADQGLAPARPPGRRAVERLFRRGQADARGCQGARGRLSRNAAAQGRHGHLRAPGGGRRGGAQDQGERAQHRDRAGRAAAKADRPAGPRTRSSEAQSRGKALEEEAEYRARGKQLEHRSLRGGRSAQSAGAGIDGPGSKCRAASAT